MKTPQPPSGSELSGKTSYQPVKMEAISKRFGTNLVLDDVSVTFFPGEVHVLAGENGAGKSTLINILSGAVERTSGTISIGDRRLYFRSPMDGQRGGVSVIHQELSLVPEMSVLDNLMLGVEPAKLGFRIAGSSRSRAEELLGVVGLQLSLDERVGSLPISICQLLEVAKALRSQSRIVVMDEPTSALNAHDADRLFAVIENLKAQGLGIVYISHKMDEIRRIADRITVLRDGRLVGTYPADDITDSRLIELMVGDKSGDAHRSAPSSNGAEVGVTALEIEALSIEQHGRPVVQNATLTVACGEVVGLAGLQGAGASELMQGLFGAAGRVMGGTIRLFDKPFVPAGPRKAISASVAYLPNDRKTSGLVLPLTVAENSVLVGLPRLSPGGWRNRRRETEEATKLAERFRVKTSTLEAPAGSLSGGNQQKVALGKWLLGDPKIMLLDEPTRGIDIGAKREIYALIDEWKAQGIAILLITSELPELLSLCDRILVMHRGRIVKQLARREATAEAVIHAAMDSQSQ